MIESYEVELNGKSYKLPVMEIAPGTGIAVFDMNASQKMSFDACIDLVRKITGVGIGHIDTVVSAETKGIILAYQVATAFGCEMTILRKEQKPYYPDVTVEAVNTYTTKGEHKLFLDNGQVDKLAGKNVLIVDDVVSTGSSLKAIERILHRVGANIVGKAFVFAEGDAYLREDIVYVGKLPVIKED